MHAFSLVEVTLALGVSAFCLIAIFGLLPIGLKSTQTAIEQTAANGILSAVAADLRATAPGKGDAVCSAQFGIAIPGDSSTPAITVLYFTGDGSFTTQYGQDARYRLTVQFLSNGAAASKMASLVEMTASWPAAADPARASGTAQLFVALDRN